MKPTGLRAALVGSLTARVLAVAWVATLVFGLIFGLVTRTVVTRELRHGLQLRAAALGGGLRAKVGEAVATDDHIGLDLLLHEAVESNLAVRYIAVVDDRDALVGHSFTRQPSSAFLAAIRDRDSPDAFVTLRTELGLVHDVIVRSHSHHGPSIHVGVDDAMVADTVFTLTIAFAVAGLVSLFVGLVIAGAVTGWISAPLREVSAAADQFATEVASSEGASVPIHPGRQAARIAETSGISEVARLAASFNRMSQALHTSQTGLAAAQQSLIHTERMAALGAFVAGTAHAINNPLGGLRACLEMIASRPGDPESQLRYAGIAGQAIDRIDDLVQRLVQFVRGDGVEQGPVDLNGLVRRSLVVSTMRDRDVQVSLDLCDGPLTVQGNGAELEQALTNLVVNAVQASPPGGEVIIRTRHHEAAAGGQPAQLQVEDRGPGIDAELRQRVFEPFFTTKPEGEGTGLGLWIVWSVVQRHGGLVTIEQPEEGGTRFIVRLPDRIGAPIRGGDNA